MDSAKLNDWIQIIGIFALVASLVFVGIQIRQAQDIAESQAYQARAATSVEFNAMRASSPEFTSATAKLYAGHPESLTAQEKVTLEYFFNGEMTMMENLHYQYELGYLPGEHWEKDVADMRCLLSHPYYREMLNWFNGRKSFQAVLDKIAADAARNPSDCWD